MAVERTVTQIEADLAAARQRLAENLTQLVAEIHPRAIVHRSLEEGKTQARQTLVDAQAKARQSLTTVKGFFFDDKGWKPDSWAIASGAVVLAVVVIAATRRK